MTDECDPAWYKYASKDEEFELATLDVALTALQEARRKLMARKEHLGTRLRERMRYKKMTPEQRQERRDARREKA